MSEKLTQSEMKMLFEYADGNLVRKITVAPNAKKGAVVGRLDTYGYLQVAIRKRRYFVHSLIWLYHHGYYPSEIDHINRIKSDNRVENLREVERYENTANTGKRVNCSSGVSGVAWHKTKNRWEAYLSYKNKIYFLGGFIDFNEAVCHRLAAEQCIGVLRYNSPAHAYVQNNIINK